MNASDTLTIIARVVHSDLSARTKIVIIKELAVLPDADDFVIGLD